MHDRPVPVIARCALLDIEGTVADIRFVYDVMFPFVRSQLQSFLNRFQDSPSVRQAIATLESDAGHPIEDIASHVNRLMDSDSKTTGLKALQGLIWESGFRSGSLRAEIFSDVLPSLQRWKQAGVDLKIYSSGSILAQKLFFGHTTQGDLTPLFTEHFDTTIGSKREASSYARIADAVQIRPADIVFLTDVVPEVDAATAVGLQVITCIRPNNAPLPDDYARPTVRSFDEIDLRPPG